MGRRRTDRLNGRNEFSDRRPEWAIVENVYLPQRRRGFTGLGASGPAFAGRPDAYEDVRARAGPRREP